MSLGEVLFAMLIDGGRQFVVPVLLGNTQLELVQTSRSLRRVDSHISTLQPSWSLLSIV
jgi:hypothetical protein